MEGSIAGKLSIVEEEANWGHGGVKEQPFRDIFKTSVTNDI